MLGYFDDPEATRAALGEGFLRTGDLGVMHPDGYVELKDRLKDIIVTGGENVSSVEVEAVLAAHPAVLEAAVVARPHPRWGETPVAVVILRPGAEATEQELIEFVRSRTAHFKAPKQIAFEELPKTSTGKVQKHLLRARLSELFGEAPTA
jgi:fatty-acyl-CoA synthase